MKELIRHAAGQITKELAAFVRQVLRAGIANPKQVVGGFAALVLGSKLSASGQWEAGLASILSGGALLSGSGVELPFIGHKEPADKTDRPQVPGPVITRDDTDVPR